MVANRFLGNPTDRDDNGGLRNRVRCGSRTAVPRETGGNYHRTRDSAHAPHFYPNHINYFGVNGNMESLDRFLLQVHRSWFKWLNRRSQRARLTWERYNDLLGDLPLPRARIVVSIWR
jgi:hypothetical protein